MGHSVTLLHPHTNCSPTVRNQPRKALPSVASSARDTPSRPPRAENAFDMRRHTAVPMSLTRSIMIVRCLWTWFLTCLHYERHTNKSSTVSRTPTKAPARDGQREGLHEPGESQLPVRPLVSREGLIAIEIRPAVAAAESSTSRKRHHAGMDWQEKVSTELGKVQMGRVRGGV